MKIYDKTKPLIFIHMPKTAGGSVRRIVLKWFQPNFHPHYFDRANGKMPLRADLLSHSTDKPLCIYGHFNKWRKFGVEDYYPDVDQFVTFLRDPFEMMVSRFRYVRGVEIKDGRKPKWQLMDLRSYLETEPIHMFNHFPRDVTFENYKDVIEEYFIEIGITEKLSISLQRIASKLGFDFDKKQLEHLNQSEKTEEIPYSIKKQYVEQHSLEFAVYKYALSKY